MADADDCGEHAVAGDGEQHDRSDAAELLPCATGCAAAATTPADGDGVQSGGDARCGWGGDESINGDAATVVTWGGATATCAVYVV